MLGFLKTSFVGPHMGRVDATFEIFDTERFQLLSPVNDGDNLEFGNSLRMFYFCENGKVQCFRVGRKSNRELIVLHSAKGAIVGMSGEGEGDISGKSSLME